VLALFGYWLPGAVVAHAVELEPTRNVILVENGQPAHSDTNTETKVDQLIDTLLRHIIRQVMQERMVSADDNNAMSTWFSFRDIALPIRPTTVKALTAFAAETQRLSADQLAVGRQVVATNLSIFATMATDFLHDNLDIARVAVSPPAVDTPVRVAPIGTAGSEVAEQNTRSAEPPNGSAALPAPVDVRLSNTDPSQGHDPLAASAVADASVALAAVKNEPPKTAPTAGIAAITPVIMAARPPLAGGTMPANGDQSAVEQSVQRGDAMLSNYNIFAARMLYEYAARAGSAPAAMKLAETYDASFLNRLKVIGPKPDPALAAEWYGKAAALGDQRAEARLRTLPPSAAR
jgi:hypothetical protein